MSLPHDAVGWSAVCDCSISWSYSNVMCNHLAEEESVICLKCVLAVFLTHGAYQLSIFCLPVRHFFCVKVSLFSQPSIKTYVVGAQKNRLIETVLLSTYNIFFC